MAENNNQNNAVNSTSELAIRREKLATLMAEGRNPFVITSFDQNAYSEDIKASYVEGEEKNVKIAGRIMAKRVMGKASFMHVMDAKGRIQCYVTRDDLGEEQYGYFKKYDIGDIVGVS